MELQKALSTIQTFKPIWPAVHILDHNLHFLKSLPKHHICVGLVFSFCFSLV
jgi:hypothetical protein